MRLQEALASKDGDIASLADKLESAVQAATTASAAARQGGEEGEEGQKALAAAQAQVWEYRVGIAGVDGGECILHNATHSPTRCIAHCYTAPLFLPLLPHCNSTLLASAYRWMRLYKHGL